MPCLVLLYSISAIVDQISMANFEAASKSDYIRFEVNSPILSI